MRTSYDKHFTKHNFKKVEKNKIFSIRNTFVTYFNDSKEKELAFIDHLNSNTFDLESLEIQIKNYKEILKAYSIYNQSSNLIKIHKILSEHKEKIIIDLLKNNQIKGSEKARKILDDIKINKWNISEKTIDRLNMLVEY